MCTNPELKPLLLKAAKNLQHHYDLYNGNDLVPLRHLNYDKQRKAIDDIKQTILTHYGPGFEVTYSDKSDKCGPLRTYSYYFVVGRKMMFLP